MPFAGLLFLAASSDGDSETEAWVYAIVAALATGYALAVVVSVISLPHRRAVLAGIAALTLAVVWGLASEYDAQEFLVVALPAAALLLLAAFRTS